MQFWNLLNVYLFTSTNTGECVTSNLHSLKSNYKLTSKLKCSFSSLTNICHLLQDNTIFRSVPCILFYRDSWLKIHCSPNVNSFHCAKVTFEITDIMKMCEFFWDGKFLRWIVSLHYEKCREINTFIYSSRFSSIPFVDTCKIYMRSQVYHSHMHSVTKCTQIENSN